MAIIAQLQIFEIWYKIFNLIQKLRKIQYFESQKTSKKFFLLSRLIIVLFESKLFFRISASVTTLVVVSACSPINRSPFDCFFFLFKQFLSHAETVATFSASANFRVCKHGPLSWRTRPRRSPSRFVVIGVTRLGTHPFSPHHPVSLALRASSLPFPVHPTCGI